MSDRHTDGKVTYIHGAKPSPDRLEKARRLMALVALGEPKIDLAAVKKRIKDLREFEQRQQRTFSMHLQHAERTTLSQLEAGENDPALAQDISQQMRDAKILSCVPASDRIRIVEGFSPIGMPDEPSVEVYYAGPAGGSVADSEPDEYDVWGTSQNPPPPAPYSLNWPLIWLWFCIIAACLTAWYLVTQIMGATGLPQFLTQILTTIISPTR